MPHGPARPAYLHISGPDALDVQRHDGFQKPCVNPPAGWYYLVVPAWGSRDVVLKRNGQNVVNLALQDW